MVSTPARRVVDGLSADLRQWSFVFGFVAAIALASGHAISGAIAAGMTWLCLRDAKKPAEGRAPMPSYPGV
jgi:uncharacterized membrane protein (DUF441 family)